MKPIKAIETFYNGYRFRSRLEARWAVFFDAIGAEWEYEPEGFVLSDGTYYLPDFLLHNVSGRGASDIYVEIQGNLTKEDLQKIDLFSRGDMEYLDPRYPIIIFGRIPNEEMAGGFSYDAIHFINGHSEIKKHYVEPYLTLDYSKDDNEFFYNLTFSEGDDYCTEPKAKIGGGLVLDYPDNPYNFVDKQKTIDAFRKARQARFEHGEKGMCP